MRGFFYLIHFFLFHKFLVLFFCFTPLFTVSGQNRQVNDLFLKAEILFKEKKFIEAEKVYAEIGKNYQQLSLQQQQLFFLHWGKGIYWKGDRTNALSTVQKVLKIDYPIEPITLYEYYSQMGAIYRESGMIDSAIVNLKNAENIKASHHLQKYHAQFILSQIYTDQAKYPEALANCLSALKLAQDLNETTNVPSILIELARINTFLKKFDDAKKIYIKSIDYQKKHGITLHLSTSYQGIATIYYDKGQYDKVIYYLNQALKYDLAEGNDYNLIYVYENLAESYNHLDDIQKAIYYHTLAQEKLNKVGTIQDKVIISTNAAGMFLKTNNYELATQNALYALNLAKKHQLTFNYLELLKILAEISSKKGQYKEAYFYSNTFNNLKDSVENIEKEKINQTLLKKYQLAEKENEINEQKLLLIEQENKTQRWVVYFLLLLSVCSILIGLIFYNRTVYQQKMNHFLTTIQNEVYQMKNDFSSNSIIEKKQHSLLANDKFSQQAIQIVETLSDFEEQMLQKFKASTSFNYLISHELKHGLRQIETNLKKFDTILSSDDKSVIKHSLNNIKSLDKLTTKLLELAKIEEMDLYLAPCKLNILIHEIIDEISLPPQGQIVLDSLPTLKIDILLFKQVFENLINNAIKYSSIDRPILIHISASTNDYFTLNIIDNGLGFDSSLSSQLFKPFHRLHQSIEGNGIGLFTIKTIIEKHGGQVFAYNNANQIGATFGFKLPLASIVQEDK